MSLKTIKSKIRATERTSKVTRAMEAVSAVKMRKSQERALGGRAYARAALRILSRVAGSREFARHPYTRGHEKGRAGTKHCYIVVTSDKGLAGSVNSAVLRLLEREIAGVHREELLFVAFGRKATDYLERRGYEVIEKHVNMSDEVSLTDTEAVVRTVTEGFLGGQYDGVSVLYQNFISTFEQKPALRRLLPLKAGEFEAVVRDIDPARGKYAEEKVEEKPVTTYTVEPSAEEVTDALVPRLLSVMLYHTLLEAKASEHSARMVAMKNATDKAKEVTKGLTISFNKARQAAITREVSEITGGIEAMAQHY